MNKSYIEYMNSINFNELGDKLVKYGLFQEKIPPVFSAEDFLDFYNNNADKFSEQEHSFITYLSQRNNGQVRPVCVPHPIAYAQLCGSIKKNWKVIREHFAKTTKDSDHKISQVHIRKNTSSDAIFQMNYKTWQLDGTPDIDLFIGKRYYVGADITKCFPSISTDTIGWAMVGKAEYNKCKADLDKPYNQIAHYSKLANNGNKVGLLLGPHSSNVISEIVLCKIDEELSKKWTYCRYIDDYHCYVDSYDQAEEFLLDLNKLLLQYNLSANNKKTDIRELPFPTMVDWIRALNRHMTLVEDKHKHVDYKDIQEYLNICVDLIKKHNNVSIFYYAMKMLKGKKLSQAAVSHYAHVAVSLSIIYPYLVPFLGEYIFDKLDLEDEVISKYISLIYNSFINKNIYESCAYALIYAIFYHKDVENFDIDQVIASNDSIFMLCAYLYCKDEQRNDEEAIKKLRAKAKSLIHEGEFDKNWLFIYECLNRSNDLDDDFKLLKKNKISFIRADYNQPLSNRIEKAQPFTYTFGEQQVVLPYLLDFSALPQKKDDIYTVACIYITDSFGKSIVKGIALSKEERDNFDLRKFLNGLPHSKHFDKPYKSVPPADKLIGLYMANGQTAQVSFNIDFDSYQPDIKAEEAATISLFALDINHNMYLIPLMVHKDTLKNFNLKKFLNTLPKAGRKKIIPSNTQPLIFDPDNKNKSMELRIDISHKLDFSKEVNYTKTPTEGLKPGKFRHVRVFRKHGTQTYVVSCYQFDEQVNFEIDLLLHMDNNAKGFLLSNDIDYSKELKHYILKQIANANQPNNIAKNGYLTAPVFKNSKTDSKNSANESKTTSNNSKDNWEITDVVKMDDKPQCYRITLSKDKEEKNIMISISTSIDDDVPNKEALKDKDFSEEIKASLTGKAINNQDYDFEIVMPSEEEIEEGMKKLNKAAAKKTSGKTKATTTKSTKSKQN